jgi:hypothetical protein
MIWGTKTLPALSQQANEPIMGQQAQSLQHCICTMHQAPCRDIYRYGVRSKNPPHSINTLSIFKFATSILWCADCAEVVPSCKFRLNGTTSNVSGALPCSNGRTWTFASGSTPNSDDQVSCSVPGNSSLAPVFSAGSVACASATSKVDVSVLPTGNSCTSSLSLGAFVGTL